MKKRIITIVAIFIMATAPSMAQVFLSDEEENYSDRIGTSSFDADLPGFYNSGDDWYTPINGSLLLVSLAGAYLIGKRKKEN